MLDPKSTITLRNAFTLVELLVVMAIISLLVSLLLPAVQSAREAGRRTACLNNIKNLQLAIINYESARQSFPPGATRSGAVWSAFILPFIEEQTIYDALTLEDPTEDDDLGPIGIRQWFLGDANLNSDVLLSSSDPIERNMAAMKQEVDIFLCPSSSGSRKGSGQGVVSVGPVEKLLVNYKVCGTNRLVEDNESGIRTETNLLLNGAFTYGGGLETQRFVDGLSKTIFIGEVDTPPNSRVTTTTCSRFEVNNGCRPCGESCVGAVRDVAFLGSDDLDLMLDFSEFCGTTAIPPKHNLTGSSCSPTCNSLPAQYELSFSSPHKGITLFAFGDGSARAIDDEIDPDVFSAMGSRYGSDIGE